MISQDMKNSRGRNANRWLCNALQAQLKSAEEAKRATLSMTLSLTRGGAMTNKNVKKQYKMIAFELEAGKSH